MSTLSNTQTSANRLLSPFYRSPLCRSLFLISPQIHTNTWSHLITQQALFAHTNAHIQGVGGWHPAALALLKLLPSRGRLPLSVMELPAVADPKRSQPPLSARHPIHSPPPSHHPQPNYTVPQRNKTRWKPSVESQYESFNSSSLSGDREGMGS